MPKIRIASVGFKQQPVASFEAFIALIKSHIHYAADWNAQLIVLPEYVTSTLIALNKDWEHWTILWHESLQELAKQFNIYILAGTHLVLNKNKYTNTAFFITPKGTLYTQKKIHLTPSEKTIPELVAGNKLTLFKTPLGKIAILICYDIEFPLLAEQAAAAGAELLLVPSYTDDLAGYSRVRTCAQARCIEHQVFVAHSALIGCLPNVRNFEQAYGAPGIYSPCDVGFPDYGIIAQGPINQELCVIGDLDFDLLKEIRSNGSVTPKRDARAVGDFEVGVVKI